MAISVGVPVNFNAHVAGALGERAIRLSENNLIRMFNSHYVAATVSGTVPTVGIEVPIVAGASFGVTGSRMSDTRFIYTAISGAAPPTVIHITVANMTTPLIPVEVATTSISHSTTSIEHHIAAISDTHFILVKSYNIAGTNKGVIQVGKYIGGVITMGSEVDFDTNLVNSPYVLSKGGGKAEIYWSRGGGGVLIGKCVRVSISDLTPTLGTTFDINSPAVTFMGPYSVKSFNDADPISRTMVTYQRLNNGYGMTISLTMTTIDRTAQSIFGTLQTGSNFNVVMMDSYWIWIIRSDPAAFPGNTAYVTQGIVDSDNVAGSWSSTGMNALVGTNIGRFGLAMVKTEPSRAAYCYLSDETNAQKIVIATEAVTPPDPSLYDQKVLGMAVGKGAGAKLYITSWKNGTIYLYEYTTPGLVLTSSRSICNASEAEVNARTYWAYPFTLPGDDDQLVIFGRMRNGIEGLGDPVHMVYSNDAGSTFYLIENSFGADHIGAVVGDNYGTFIYAVRNISGTNPKIYGGLPNGFLSLMSTIPISGGVNPQALRVDFNDNILAAVDAANTVMTVYSVPPYVSWNDFTFDHLTNAGVNSIIVL